MSPTLHSIPCLPCRIFIMTFKYRFIENKISQIEGFRDERIMFIYNDSKDIVKMKIYTYGYLHLWAKKSEKSESLDLAFMFCKMKMREKFNNRLHILASLMVICQNGGCWQPPSKCNSCLFSLSIKFQATASIHEI